MFRAGDVRELVGLYYDVQKLRLAAEARARVTEYLYCGNRHLIPLPRKAGEPYRCPLCGAPAERVVREKPRVISEVAEALGNLEKAVYAELYRLVREDPLWRYYLSGVRGVGPVIAAYLIGVLHPSRFDDVSSLWRYCGLNVVHRCPRCGYTQDPPGTCPSCGVKLVGMAPKREAGKRAGFNPHARTMAWRIADSFAKQGGVYKELYRLRLEYELARAEREGIRRDRAVARARRWLAKVFLSHYWEAGRRILGLPAPPPYILTRPGHRYIPPLVDDEGVKDEFYRNVVAPQGREYEALFKQWLEKLTKGGARAEELFSPRA